MAAVAAVGATIGTAPEIDVSGAEFAPGAGVLLDGASVVSSTVIGVGATLSGNVAGAAAKSNSWPSNDRRNSTGVAHSISFTSVNTALRASDTAASIAY